MFRAKNANVAKIYPKKVTNFFKRSCEKKIEYNRTRLRCSRLVYDLSHCEVFIIDDLNIAYMVNSKISCFLPERQFSRFRLICNRFSVVWCKNNALFSNSAITALQFSNTALATQQHCISNTAILPWSRGITSFETRYLYVLTVVERNECRMLRYSIKIIMITLYHYYVLQCISFKDV